MEGKDEFIFARDDLLLKIVQMLVAQQRVVSQMPLASAVVVGVAVAFSREVYPLGVSKLVAHERQVTLTLQGQTKIHQPSVKHER